MLENFTAAVFSISDTENTESITSDCVSQICSFFTSLFFLRNSLFTQCM